MKVLGAMLEPAERRDWRKAVIIDPYLITKLLKFYATHDAESALSNTGLLGDLRTAIIWHFYSQPANATCYVRIGKREYDATQTPMLRVPAYQELVRQWQRFGYGPHSNKRHQCEWSIIQAYMRVLDHDTLLFTSNLGEGIDYPELPLDLTSARKVIDYACYAVEITASFPAPTRSVDEPERLHWARVANDFEKHVFVTMPPEFEAEVIAMLSANVFLFQSIENPPEVVDWKESWESDYDDPADHYWCLTRTLRCDCYTEGN